MRTTANAGRIGEFWQMQDSCSLDPRKQHFESMCFTTGSIFEVNKRRRVQPLLTLDLIVLLVELGFVSTHPRHCNLRCQNNVTESMVSSHEPTHNCFGQGLFLKES